jgi:hypothetical protein
MDFIVGEKFYDIADFIFSLNDKDDYNYQVNTFNIDNLKDINIVYLHTIYKDYFFDIIRNLNFKFIVVTHNSDVNINSVDNLPDNVIKWYSQNVNFKDERLESIPIGLENSRWFPEVKKKNSILEKLKTDKNIRNLVYMNHNINTNVKERRESYNLLFDKKFVTTQMSYNGQNFDNYIDNIYNHKFVVCPEGNGIDTHRKWETLYLNSIPIEKRCINSSFYEDLPICLVDSWSDITEDFLNREYDRIKNKNCNVHMLNMSYWKNKIIKNE